MGYVSRETIEFFSAVNLVTTFCFPGWDNSYCRLQWLFFTIIYHRKCEYGICAYACIYVYAIYTLFMAYIYIYIFVYIYLYYVCMVSCVCVCV